MLTTEDVIEILAIDLIGIVPEDKAIVISTNKGVPIVLDDKAPASIAFHNIARRLLGEEVPFMDIRETPNFIERFVRFVRQG
jgi:septum site-determining protein MinD